MTQNPDEMIHDLKALDEFFMEQNGGSSPVCLAYAVAIIEKYKAYEQAKQEKEKAVDDFMNRLSCVNCDRFGIDCGSCEAGECD